ncbi:winged helix DNA-binding protein [Sulfolobus sp. E5-1-F]|uniref:winged helix DNA-binding protein n=1 Tax=Saccharolobus sp. E5-1-F TaxID=2663019 RepID=UPI001297E2DB|nr:winged helix DNA-binding protein [Sulfolobus sp. E5-1-F]QGA54549.1 winged helix DNA-binding protein [Sulfolobus sp. E5-1-F]
MKIRDQLMYPTAKILLVLLDGPKTDKEIREILGMSLTTYHENITWLIANGYIEKKEERYTLTEKARQQLIKTFLPFSRYIEKLKETAITLT